jgi:hypothetical protein
MGALAPLQAQKTDVVVLRNGDRITGEVKGVSRGTLDYSTDDAGRLAIEWDKVLRLTSRNTFEVELSSGQKLFGSLAEAGQDGTLVVSGASIATVAIVEVVGMTRIRGGFWSRLRGNLDLGLTYAKANSNLQLTSSGEIKWRGTRLETGFNFSTYLQSQTNTPSVNRNSLGAGVQYFVAPRWSVGALGQLQQNDELNLALRATLGAVAMRTLIQNNRVEFRIPAGLIANRERFYGSDSITVSAEVLLGAELVAFRFDTPKLDFSGSTYAYPSLTESGRVRVQLDSRVKYEVLRDFFVGFRITDSYDSKPPQAGTSKNDFTTEFSIGWSFHE